MRDYEDLEIYKGLQSDQDWAYKMLLKYHTQKIKEYVIKNGGDQDDAIEIEQRCLIILYENIVSGKFKYNNSVKISTYLFSIGQHQWLNELGRKKKKLPILEFNYSHFPENESDELKFSEQEEILFELLNHLDPICYQLIKHKYYDNWNDEMISKKIDSISHGNIRKRRYKCVEKLKVQFFKKMHTISGDI